MACQTFETYIDSLRVGQKSRHRTTPTIIMKSPCENGSSVGIGKLNRPPPPPSHKILFKTLYSSQIGIVSVISRRGTQQSEFVLVSIHGFFLKCHLSFSPGTLGLCSYFMFCCCYCCSEERYLYSKYDCQIRSPNN